MISEARPRTHIIFAQDEQQFKDFQPHEHFKTTPELADAKFLELDPKSLGKQALELSADNVNLKNKYNRLAEYIQKEETLTKLLLKLAYEKNLLGKERKMVKKNKKDGTKVHKFFMERKK